MPFGPRQVVARVNQDQVIAPQITLWNQQGSEVIQGTLLVIPIEESLIYIRPLYLRSSGGKIPELKRVVVAYRNQIVMEESLEQGLERLFPSGREGRRAPAPARATAAGPAAPGGVAPGLMPWERAHPVPDPFSRPQLTSCPAARGLTRALPGYSGRHAQPAPSGMTGASQARSCFTAPPKAGGASSSTLRRSAGTTVSRV
jgi:hypothetical protein